MRVVPALGEFKPRVSDVGGPTGGIGSAQRVRRTREHWTGPQEGGRARERSSWPTGVWGHRKRAARAVQARALDGPPGGRPSARALELADGGLGASEARSACGAGASTGRAPRREAERESARAGRRGVWGHRKRAARAVQARALDGPPGGRPSARALELADGVWGHRKRAARAAHARALDGPPGSLEERRRRVRPPRLRRRDRFPALRRKRLGLLVGHHQRG